MIHKVVYAPYGVILLNNPWVVQYLTDEEFISYTKIVENSPGSLIVRWC